MIFTKQANLNNNKIINVVDPSGAQDAATKNYVDTHASTAAVSRTKTTFTATAGQTAFTVPAYTTGQGLVDVFFNGSHLDATDFTETNSTTVTLAAAALNDKVTIITYATPNAASSSYSVVSVNFAASPYTVTPVAGEVVYFIDATGGNVVINLPTAIGNTAKYQIKKVDSTANTITVDANGSQTIDGSLTAVISVPNLSITLISDNANLRII